jgi:hypothetical protein
MMPCDVVTAQILARELSAHFARFVNQGHHEVERDSDFFASSARAQQLIEPERSIAWLSLSPLIRLTAIWSRTVNLGVRPPIIELDAEGGIICRLEMKDE